MPTVIPGQSPERLPTTASPVLSRAIGDDAATLAPDDGSQVAECRDPEFKRGVEVPKADQKLKKKTLTNLVLLAKRAYDRHRTAGLIDVCDSFVEWRHRV